MRAVAAHNGGSCQVSISYDFGKTFKTLRSFIGDCPRGAVENQLKTNNQTFEFWIPSETPGGSILFAWYIESSARNPVAARTLTDN